MRFFCIVKDKNGAKGDNLCCLQQQQQNHSNAGVLYNQTVVKDI
jgi:hypothetical protein